MLELEAGLEGRVEGELEDEDEDELGDESPARPSFMSPSAPLSAAASDARVALTFRVRFSLPGNLLG
jgi:hypothetical protein